MTAREGLPLEAVPVQQVMVGDCMIDGYASDTRDLFDVTEIEVFDTCKGALWILRSHRTNGTVDELAFEPDELVLRVVRRSRPNSAGP
ncbi:hypothetical protein ACFXG4_07725 [Nocardia sp. NPDC059246]|uniref:hypothetical protein n=1 Tax=unclassified Nocardia TaxID=2637762 RepID=UPI00367DC40E